MPSSWAGRHNQGECATRLASRRLGLCQERPSPDLLFVGVCWRERIAAITSQIASRYCLVQGAKSQALPDRIHWDGGNIPLDIPWLARLQRPPQAAVQGIGHYGTFCSGEVEY